MWPAFCVLSGFGFCLVKTGLLTGFAYQIDLHRTLIARFDQQMAGFGAEMGHVDDGCGIIRAHCNLCAGLQRRQSFAQFQHGEGAQEARGIKVMCFHAPRSTPDVTPRPQSCDHWPRDAALHPR